MPSNPESFGERLAQARTSRGLSQVALGEILTARLIEDDRRDPGERAIGAWAISSWECNRHIPDLWKLTALCKILQVSADMLLGLCEFAMPTYRAAG